MSWYPTALPPLGGRTYLVTGANAGLGFFTSARLAGAGAHVVLSGRSPERLAAAVAAIRERLPEASVDTLVMDVSSLDSVGAAASQVQSFDRLDGLVLNAGSVHPPRAREVSADGHELVLATNHLGHFAFVAQVLPVLERSDAARIVWLGSLSSRLSGFDLEGLQLEDSYDFWTAYAHSKIAAQSTGFELARRLETAGSSVSSIVAHPGYSISGRTPYVPGVNEPSGATRFADNLQAPFTQGKHRGAASVLVAAAAPEAGNGDYWGPRWWTKGVPTRHRPARTSIDRAIASQLWTRSEQWTGQTVPVAG
ncbi:oxidoreductase [Agromyces rhizosphaerae]|uniref:Oxidoreductase n=1 Tax=Agromyces rhizosphaerae TaxID=88374 RepID=A0A9W6CVH1_9MICO|nr:SDR family NAD(P)-dependent oxidoreductase [Agromyces rhizosphaerae]GLI27544.1 oxidoreductase [Agromyces rhizosphaerae]